MKDLLSHWEGCFKLEMVVGFGLNWNRNSKDKKGLEGVQKDELTYPGAVVGRQFRMLMVRDGVWASQGEPSWALVVWQCQRATEKTVDGWNGLKWERREKAVIYKHFNCKVV